MIVRSQVINKAKEYIEYFKRERWYAPNDVAVFGSGKDDFHSCFRSKDEKGNDQRYEVMPYVISGTDDPKTFQQRIDNGVCPGGWDHISGKGTRAWGWGEPVTKRLAGIDCIGYVLRCWQIDVKRLSSSRCVYTSNTIPEICVKIDEKNGLKAGDILCRPSVHVAIFDKLVGTTQMHLYEALDKKVPFTSLNDYKRWYRHSDKEGCVVDHPDYPVNCKVTSNYTFNMYGEIYTPYSIFPQFERVEPRYRRVSPQPTFKIIVRGSGVLDARFILDGMRHFGPQKRKYSAKSILKGTEFVNFLELDYPLPYPLKLGWHTLLIEATNTVAGQSFQDELFWRFEVPLKIY